MNSLKKINEILQNDGVIAFVTDTVWGIGCLPTSEKAVQRIYEIKKREAKKPLILMSDDISNLPYLKRLSNATVKTIKFSIGLSMCINLLAVTLSVMGILNPTTGALVHNAGSCLVVLIAALLYDRKFK